MMYWKDMSRTKVRVFGLLLASMFLVPFASHAEFLITEIHYNPEGSDGGLEWVEIWNNDTGSASFEEFKLKENGTNHKIKTVIGDFNMSGLEYAIIADNAEKFRAKYPNYSGTLFDSAFSLSNTGEILELIEPSGSVVFEVTYANTGGGNGNGNSVGLIDQVWKEVNESPGEFNTQYIAPASEPSVQSEENNSSQTNEVQPDKQPTQAVDTLPATYIEIKNPDYSEKLIKIDAQGDRTVMAGVEYWFTGKVYGLQGGIISEPTATWNWGDGTSSAGITSTHRYKYPGVYTATLSGKVSGYSSRDRVQINVIEPALTLGIREDEKNRSLLVLVNQSNYTLEISGYQLHTQDNKFSFPDHSFINAQQTMVIDPELLGVDVQQIKVVTFSDGNHNIIDTFSVTEQLLKQEIESISVGVADSEISEKISTEALSEEITSTETSEDSRATTHSVVYRQQQEQFEINQFESREEDRQQQAVEFSETPSFEKLQQAQLLGSLNDTKQNTRNLYQIALVALALVALGMYLFIYIRERKNHSLSGINIID